MPNSDALAAATQFIVQGRAPALARGCHRRGGCRHRRRGRAASSSTWCTCGCDHGRARRRDRSPRPRPLMASPCSRRRRRGAGLPRRDRRPARPSCSPTPRSTASTSSRSPATRLAHAPALPASSPPVPFPKPPPPAGLAGHPERFRVEGGTRITGVRVPRGERRGQPPPSSTATGPATSRPIRSGSAGPDLDPPYAGSASASRPVAPSRFDCRPRPRSPPEQIPEPLIDYLAKDYASFRQALLDLIRVAVSPTDRPPRGRPRHRAPRAPRVRGRPPELLPGRGGQRAAPRYRTPQLLGAAPRASRRLPHARRRQRAHVRPAPRRRSHRHAPCRRARR